MERTARTLFVVICLAAIASGTADGQLGPGGGIQKRHESLEKLQILPEIRRPGHPPPPILGTPADNQIVYDAAVVFSWQGGQGVPRATSYRVCVAEETRSCNDPGAWVYPSQGQRPLTGTGLKHDLPASFHGKRLTWTVMACAPSQLQIGSGPALLCTPAAARRLTWLLRAPTLLQPADGAGVPSLRPAFRWSGVSGAEMYKLCVSQPGVACGTQARETVQTVLFDRPASQGTSYTPQSDLRQFEGHAVHWTAAACSSAGCSYQQQVREIRLPIRMYVRNWSQFDVNQVWLVRSGGPGAPPVRELLTSDLSRWRDPRPSGGYNDETLVYVPKRHTASQEPNVTPYYVLEYVQERISIPADGSHRPVYHAAPLSSVAFAPGVNRVPGYAIVRETLFIFDHSGSPRSRHEQVLRGTDGRLYLYRPGASFEGHPEVVHGPIVLQTLINEGYRAYDASHLNP